MKLLPIIATLIFIITLPATGQDKTTLARAEYRAAEESYGNGKFAECLAHLGKSKEYFGGTNYLIQYLEVKALYADGQLMAASRMLDTFFQSIPQDNGTPQYSEMKELVKTIKSDVKALEDAYQTVISSKTRSSAESFLKYSGKANPEYTKVVEATLIEIANGEVRSTFQKLKSQADSEYAEYIRFRKKKRTANVIGTIAIAALPIGLKMAITDKNYEVGVPLAAVGFFLPINRFSVASDYRYSANKKYKSYSKLIDDANALGYQKLTKNGR